MVALSAPIGDDHLTWMTAQRDKSPRNATLIAAEVAVLLGITVSHVHKRLERHRLAGHRADVR